MSVEFDFDAPPPDPIPACARWLEAAKGTGLPNPNAMSLATVDAAGRPSVRAVLLKGFDARGAVFYTNAHSRKGSALAATGRAALLFFWDPLDRQLQIEGAVTSASEAESDAYFATRPRESQLGAWASAQSRPLASREAFLDLYDQAARRFPAAVPRPPHWHGFRVAPERIEFWQGHPHRLHDRMEYLRQADGSYLHHRLFP